MTRFVPAADKDRAICKWAWIEALKVVADHMGGSETLVICSTRTQSEASAPQTTSGCSRNK